jgi:hypothetical protein
MATNLRNSALIAAALTLCSAHAAAQGNVGTRAAGLAGAFVAVADDATAVYWNPAGVATGSLVSLVLDAGHSRSGQPQPQASGFEGDTVGTVALSATAIGLALYRLESYGTRAAEPAVTGPGSREEVGRSVQAITTATAGVSLVHSLTDHIIIGATPKLMRGDGHVTADVDAGVMAWVDRFRVGLVARNLTTPGFGVKGVELDREVRVGAAWGSNWTGISRLIVSADADLLSRATPGGDRRDLAAGVETCWLGQRLGVRGGVRGSTIGDARAAVAAGLSAGLWPGLLVEAHVARGRAAERSWSVGARMTY